MVRKLFAFIITINCDPLYNVFAHVLNFIFSYAITKHLILKVKIGGQTCFEISVKATKHFLT